MTEATPIPPRERRQHGSWSTAGLRSAVRPIVVILFALLFGGIVVFQIPVPERAWTILETILLFFFISRGQEVANRKEG